MGLSTMSERADAVGAKLTVTSTPGIGTRVTLLLTLPTADRGTVTSR